MKIRYLDMVGDPVEVDWEQFKTDYVEGKINPNQNVTVNGTPVSVPKLLEIIEEAEDNATLRTARKAMLEEEQFQKTAPWWLKPKARWLITLSTLLLSFYFIHLPFNVTDGTRYALATLVWIFWLYYYHIGGAKRYNNILDLICLDEHRDIISQIEEKRKLKRGSNGGDKDGGKDHS